MSKIKYLVTGMNNQELGGLVGTLIGGELTGEAELLCCPGNPQAFKVGPAGQVTELPFSTLLSDLVRQGRVRLNLPVTNTFVSGAKEIVRISQGKVEPA